MAAVWTSALKRLLYPLAFTYMRTGNETLLHANYLYAFIFVGAIAVLLLEDARIARLLAAHRAVPIAIGLGGMAGIALLAHPTLSGMSGAPYAGAALVALYIPVHAVYWLVAARALQETGGTPHRATRDALASFALFVALFTAVSAAGLQTAQASVLYPALSTAMMLACPALQARGTRQASDAAHPEAATPAGDAVAAQAADSPEPDGAVAAGQGEAAPQPIAPDAPGLPGSSGPASATARDSAAPAIPGTAAAPRAVPPHPDALAVPILEERFARQFGLSQRETELSAYAYRNYSAKRIAAELFIAESTVYTHLKRIYRKTGVHSKQELIDFIDEWIAAQGDAVPGGSPQPGK